MTRATTRSRRTLVLITGLAVLITAGGFLGMNTIGQPMKLYEQRIISGRVEDVWSIATDVDRWPEWDPHEEAGELFGRFEIGTKAYSKPRGGPGAHWTLTEVTENRSWSLINPMRIGTLKVDNLYTAMPDGRVLCEKTMNVSGWILVALFKLHFESATRKDMQATWSALEERLGS